MGYSEEDIFLIQSKIKDLRKGGIGLQFRLTERRYSNERAREFAVHGLCRRLSTVQECLDRVFSYVPIEESESVPSKETRVSAEICLQCFFLNIYGSLDNLAWIWAIERSVFDEEIETARQKISFKSKPILKSFTSDLKAWVESKSRWLNIYLSDFRHALAHRIPFYIPPFKLQPEDVETYNRLESEKQKALLMGRISVFEEVEAEQRRMERFEPVIYHSFSENADGVFFHDQIVVDYWTLQQLVTLLFNELDSFSRG